jgi:hypothetical protein
MMMSQTGLGLVVMTSYSVRTYCDCTHACTSNERQTSQSKANIEAKTNKRWTALHTASRYGHLEMVQFLAHQCQAKCTCCDQGQ